MSRREETDLGKLLRNKRDEFRIEIRKKTLDELLMAKRSIVSDSGPTTEEMPLEMRLQQISQAIVEFKGAFDCNNLSGATQALTHIRMLISIKENPPIKHVIKTGIVPHLVECLDLKYVKFTDLQHEASWIITNLAGGDSLDCHHLVQYDCIEKCMALLEKTEDLKIRETTLWGLANICSDNLAYRDLMVNNNIFDIVLGIASSPPYEAKIVKLCVWFISNISRGRPYPPEKEIIKAIPFLVQSIHSEDEELLQDVLWGLSFITDSSLGAKSKVVDYKVIPRVLKLMLHKNLRIKVPALRTIGNLANSLDEHTMLLIQSGVIGNLSHFMDAEEFLIKREACWCISNILAGPPEHIQPILDSDLFPKLLVALRNDHFAVRRESAICFANACVHSNLMQIEYMVSNGLLEAIFDTFTQHDNNLILISLQCLTNLLKHGQSLTDESTPNPIITLMEQKGLFQPLEELQKSDDPKIFGAVYKLIEQFFKYDVQNMEPQQGQ